MENKFDIASIVSAIIAFNALLVGIRSVLEWMKDKTDTTLDNKIHAILVKVLDVLLKVVDVAGNTRK